MMLVKRQTFGTPTSAVRVLRFGGIGVWVAAVATAESQGRQQGCLPEIGHLVSQGPKRERAMNETSLHNHHNHSFLSACSRFRNDIPSIIHRPLSRRDAGSRANSPAAPYEKRYEKR